jgi:hypothetical protein
MNFFKLGSKTDDFDDPFDISIVEASDVLGDLSIFEKADLKRNFIKNLSFLDNLFDVNYFNTLFSQIDELEVGIISYFFVYENHPEISELLEEFNKTGFKDENLKEVFQDILILSGIKFVRIRREEKKIKMLSFSVTQFMRLIEVLNKLKNGTNEWYWDILISEDYKSMNISQKLLILSLIFDCKRKLFSFCLLMMN